MSGNLKLENLSAFYLDELKDAYDFEHQILAALPKMERSASSTALQNAFRDHRRQTENQVDRLERVFGLLDVEAVRKTCKGMKGLLAEGEEYVKAKGDEATIDAALIAAAQRVEHYEIAAYGTLRAYADLLGHADQAQLHQETLDEESAADVLLSNLAGSGVNARAAAANPASTTAGERPSDKPKERGANERRSGEVRTTSRRKTASGSGNGNRALEGRTKQELYSRAKQLRVDGRSSMSKGELVAAIRGKG